MKVKCRWRYAEVQAHGCMLTVRGSTGAGETVQDGTWFGFSASRSGAWFDPVWSYNYIVYFYLSLFVISALHLSFTKAGKGPLL